MIRHYAIAALLVLILFARVDAREPLVLKMNHQFPKNTPGSKIDQWFANEVKQRTRGEVFIRIFWDNGLGGADENLSMISRGVLDMAAMSAGYFPDKLPLTAAPNSIPMAMDNVCQASGIMAALADQIPEISQEHEDLGIKPLFFHVLNPYYLVSREPVERLGDLKGKRIRTWGRYLPKLVQAAGAKPVPLFLPDVYPAMEKGIIDACPFSLDLMVSYRMYQVAGHVTRVILWEGPSWGVWISSRVWEKLSPDNRRIFMDTAKEARQKELAGVMAAEADAGQLLIQKGVRFHAFNPSDLDRWRNQAPDFFDRFILAMGARGKDDAARRMVSLWKKLRREIKCP